MAAAVMFYLPNVYGKHFAFPLRIKSDQVWIMMDLESTQTREMQLG